MPRRPENAGFPSSFASVRQDVGVVVGLGVGLGLDLGRLGQGDAGALLQGWTSTYFTLQGIDSEFRYPPSHPKNIIVRDRTSATLDVWVERAAIGGDEPMIIWQIREHNPYKREHSNVLGEETFVSHAEIVQRLTKSDRSMIEIGAGLLALAFALALLGVGAKRWNRKRASREN